MYWKSYKFSKSNRNLPIQKIKSQSPPQSRFLHQSLPTEVRRCDGDKSGRGDFFWTRLSTRNDIKRTIHI